MQVQTLETLTRSQDFLDTRVKRAKTMADLMAQGQWEDGVLHTLSEQYFEGYRRKSNRALYEEITLTRRDHMAQHIYSVIENLRIYREIHLAQRLCLTWQGAQTEKAQPTPELPRLVAPYTREIDTTTNDCRQWFETMEEEGFDRVDVRDAFKAAVEENIEARYPRAQSQTAALQSLVKFFQRRVAVVHATTRSLTAMNEVEMAAGILFYQRNIAGYPQGHRVVKAEMAKLRGLGRYCRTDLNDCRDYLNGTADMLENHQVFTEALAASPRPL